MSKYMSRIAKVIATAALTAVLAVSLTACDSEGEKTDVTTSADVNDSRFESGETVYDENSPFSYAIIVDKTTGVQYLYIKKGSGKSATGGPTVLVDANGHPILAEGYEHANAKDNANTSEQ